MIRGVAIKFVPYLLRDKRNNNKKQQKTKEKQDDVTQREGGLSPYASELASADIFVPKAKIHSERSFILDDRIDRRKCANKKQKKIS